MSPVLSFIPPKKASWQKTRNAHMKYNDMQIYTQTQRLSD